MGIEIERKFLLADDSWRAQVSDTLRMRQGYLSREVDSAIRVRICGADAHINLKHTYNGIERSEFEYPIPLADAEALLDKMAQGGMIEKARHHVRIAQHLWEIDEFFGDNQGLIVAEIELGHIDEAFERPFWLGREVSTERRYFNSALVDHPYCDW